MKKKLIALVCALALAVGLVGCSLSTPDSVGTIGNVDISSGLYLLAQFDAYQTAADLASDDQDATKVSSFLKATIDRKSVRVGKECRSRWSPYH